MKYRVVVNGIPITVRERFLRVDVHSTEDLDWAYVLANRTPGAKVVGYDQNGQEVQVKTLRHLMKGTLPEDVNLEPHLTKR